MAFFSIISQWHTMDQYSISQCHYLHIYYKQANTHEKLYLTLAPKNKKCRRYHDNLNLAPLFFINMSIGTNEKNVVYSYQPREFSYLTYLVCWIRHSEFISYINAFFSLSNAYL